jgi:hypothetical protein
VIGAHPVALLEDGLPGTLSELANMPGRCARWPNMEQGPVRRWNSVRESHLPLSCKRASDIQLLWSIPNSSITSTPMSGSGSITANGASTRIRQG